MSKKQPTKKKAGRPPLKNPANKLLPAIRVTEKSLIAYRDAARREGSTFADWVRKAMDTALRKNK